MQTKKEQTPMAKDLRTHEVEYNFGITQDFDPQPKVETVTSPALSTEEFIQKRKVIVDKLIEMSIDPEQT